MKTKNNVQKTILRSVAVIVSFVLISFTVSAQDFWKKLLANSSFNEIALAMVETSNKTKNTDSSSSDFYFIPIEEVVEPALDMEVRMYDESNFRISNFEIVEEADNVLELEDWMFNESLFQVEEIEEQPLELENWMTSDKGWNI